LDGLKEDGMDIFNFFFGDKFRRKDQSDHSRTEDIFRALEVQ
jgi:hypothetical protein